MVTYLVDLVGQGQSSPKIIEISTKVFCISDPNLSDPSLNGWWFMVWVSSRLTPHPPTPNTHIHTQTGYITMWKSPVNWVFCENIGWELFSIRHKICPRFCVPLFCCDCTILQWVNVAQLCTGPHLNITLFVDIPSPRGVSPSTGTVLAAMLQCFVRSFPGYWWCPIPLIYQMTSFENGPWDFA